MLGGHSPASDLIRAFVSIWTDIGVDLIDRWIKLYPTRPFIDGDMTGRLVIDRDFNASLNLMQAGKVIPGVPVESTASC